MATRKSGKVTGAGRDFSAYENRPPPVSLTDAKALGVQAGEQAAQTAFQQATGKCQTPRADLRQELAEQSRRLEVAGRSAWPGEVTTDLLNWFTRDVDAAWANYEDGVSLGIKQGLAQALRKLRCKKGKGR